jgi:hypothetical protein
MDLKATTLLIKWAFSNYKGATVNVFVRHIAKLGTAALTWGLSLRL